MSEMTQQDNEALIRSINYWIENWDFECPALFGLEKSDLEAISTNWPNSYANNRELVLLACLGSLRELLFGASAVPQNIVKELIGINYEQASELRNSLHQQYKKYEL